MAAGADPALVGATGATGAPASATATTGTTGVPGTASSATTLPGADPALAGTTGAAGAAAVPGYPGAAATATPAAGTTTGVVGPMPAGSATALAGTPTAAGAPGIGAPAGAAQGVGGPGYGPTGQSGQAEAPKTYDGFAKQAFANGKDKDAYDYLLAYALTNDQGGKNLIQSMKWVSGLKRPSVAVRWGVGVHVSAPKELQPGGYAPIGTTQQISQRGGSSGQGASGAPGTSGGFAGNASGNIGGIGGSGGGNSGGPLAPYAGDLAASIVTGLQERVGNGAFGNALKDASATAGGGQGAPGQGLPGAAGFGGAGGPGISGVGGAGGVGGAASASAMLMPGVTFLGAGSEKEIVAKAREAALDVLLFFEVDVRRGRAGPIGNDTKVHLIDVAKARKFFTSVELNNVKVQKARADNKPDGVDTEVKRLFAAADKELAMGELPAALTPAVALNRVSTLSAAKHENPLPVLAEMKFYHASGLLKDEDLVHGFDGIVGASNGIKLALGSEEERKAIVSKYLPK